MYTHICLQYVMIYLINYVLYMWYVCNSIYSLVEVFLSPFYKWGRSWELETDILMCQKFIWARSTQLGTLSMFIDKVQETMQGTMNVIVFYKQQFSEWTKIKSYF